MLDLNTTDMTPKAFRRFVNEIISGINDRNLICKVLVSNGFRFFFSGDFKKAYRHPEHPQYIVKVYRPNKNCEDDSQTVPVDIKPFYLHPFELNENFMIQEFANGEGGTSKDAFSWFRNHHPKLVDIRNFMDVQQKNTRYHNGSPVIIDFLS